MKKVKSYKISTLSRFILKYRKTLYLTTGVILLVFGILSAIMYILILGETSQFGFDQVLIDREGFGSFLERIIQARDVILSNPNFEGLPIFISTLLTQKYLNAAICFTVFGGIFSSINLYIAIVIWWYRDRTYQSYGTLYVFTFGLIGVLILLGFATYDVVNIMTSYAALSGMFIIFVLPWLSTNKLLNSRFSPSDKINERFLPKEAKKTNFLDKLLSKAL